MKKHAMPPVSGTLCRAPARTAQLEDTWRFGGGWVDAWRGKDITFSRLDVVVAAGAHVPEHVG